MMVRLQLTHDLLGNKMEVFDSDKCASLLPFGQTSGVKRLIMPLAIDDIAAFHISKKVETIRLQIWQVFARFFDNFLLLDFFCKKKTLMAIFTI